MSQIQSKEGQIQLSAKKIIVLSFIVAFFSVVANIWEIKQRITFHKMVKYKTFTKKHLQKVLDDFECMVSCKDPYIENFNKKNPEFSGVHHLWTLNSHQYWTDKFKAQLERREQNEI